MMGDRFGSWIRISLLAATVSLMFSSLAWGQYAQYDGDDRYDRRDQAGDQGYRNGYRDGQSRGEYDAQRGRRFKFKTDDWEDSRGFEHWMGNKGEYKHAYRDGYERGYRQGYSSNGYRRNRDDWR